MRSDSTIDSDADQAFALALDHHRAGRLTEAERGYRDILQRDPAHADALHFLGVLAFQSGKLEPALELIHKSVTLRPDGAVYRNNLAQVLERMGREEDAAREYSAAIELDPSYAEPLNNLGRLLEKLGRPSKAESCYRNAIRLDARYADPHTNLGNVLKDRGELDAAIESYRRAIALNPTVSSLHSNLLLTLHYHPGYSPADLLREHQAWARRHVAPLAAMRRPHPNDRDPNRRLRIGYVSPDFREHAVARFILPVLEQHDPNRVEIYAYADVRRPDDVTGEIRALVREWRDTDTLSDAQLADTVRNDAIDILVDLAAHSGRNRLLAFAHKPAPVQVTWLAYCSTTGVDAIDYRLTDEFLDPSDSQLDRYVERTVRLPATYWCYSAPRLAPEHMPPAQRRAGAPTFGCLNNFAKVTGDTLALWMDLLRRVPEANLLLHTPAPNHVDRVSEAMQKAGLENDRVRFVPRQSFADYLRAYGDIDVALDPFPFGGGTTTCDALWMGVPVVTLTGNTAVSRAGSSLLSNIGLERCIAHTKEEYLNVAAALIRDSDELARLRSSLRERLQSSPIMDAQRFTRDLEAAYRGMWRDWCAGR